MSMSRIRQRLKKIDSLQIFGSITLLLMIISVFKIFNATSSPLSSELQSSMPSVGKPVTDKSTELLQSDLPAASPVENTEILSNAISSYPRENATIMSLCRNEDMYEIMRSVRRLEDRFNHKFHYDWVFLNNQEFSEEFKTKVGNLVSGNAKFGLIPEEHWSYPDYIDLEKAREERKKMADKGIIYADLESYRHMCRFNSGFFYKHPLMMDYKYYWRVEPDVKFYCDIDKDPFKYLRETEKVYGFTISIHEFQATIESLWPTIKKFLSERPKAQHPNSFIDFISNDKGETYNLCHFWSNFEIADMDFWRSPIYEEFFEYLDKSGGFFYERWGDAPVHSIAVSLFLDQSKIHYFEDIGYNHGVYSMCPIDDYLWLNNKCNCNMNDDFTFRGYSCGRKYYDVTKKEKPKNWRDYTD